MRDYRKRGGDDGDGGGGGGAAPGKRTLTQRLAARVQLQASAPAEDAGGAHAHAHEHDDAETGGGGGGGTTSRFTDDPELRAVAAGTRELVKGDRGTGVRRIQQALHDLDYLVNVHGLFEDRTEEQVKAVQRSTGVFDSGKVNQQTLAALERRFGTRTPYVDAAKHEAPGLHPKPGEKWDAANPPSALMRHVHTLSPAEKAEADAALSPVTRRDDGTVPEYDPDLPAGNYKTRLDALVRAKVKAEWESMGKGAIEAHKDKKNLFSLDDAEDVGEQSKKSTDKVFGSWATGKAMKAGVNLKDKFTVESDKIDKMNPEEKLEKAAWRVEKILRSAEVAALNAEHGVDRTRTVEGDVIAGVKAKVAEDCEEMLLETQRGWTASANSEKGEVYLRLFKAKTDDGNRSRLWRMYGTLVHEYLHTLANPAWDAWKKKVTAADDGKGQTLGEGVTEHLTRTVLVDVNPSEKALRQAVEGDYYDDEVEAPEKIERSSYQADLERAEKLVGAVGIHNLYAAYFVGQTHLVGG